MNSKVYIADSACTSFGAHYEQSLADSCREVTRDIDLTSLDAIYFASFLTPIVGSQSHLASYLSEVLNFKGPIFPVESACASGGLAAYMGAQAVRAGIYRRVLVLGAEKMTDASRAEIQSGLMQASGFEERSLNLSFSEIYALLAQSYREQYGLSEETLAEISVHMHQNALTQNRAQFQKSITVQDVMNSPMLAEPLRRFHASPLSDGACAVVLTAEETSFEMVDSEFQLDVLSVESRLQNPGFPAVQRAAQALYQRAGITAHNLQFLELHDCFSIAFLIALEDLGLLEFGHGKNWKNLPQKINLSGGLKAFGHPVSATGVRQIHSIRKQLADAPSGTLGLTHNVGGSGGSAVLHLIQKV